MGNRDLEHSTKYVLKRILIQPIIVTNTARNPLTLVLLALRDRKCSKYVTLMPGRIKLDTGSEDKRMYINRIKFENMQNILSGNDYTLVN